MTASSSLRIAIIGAGPVGLAAGRELLQNGIRNFTIFEKAAKAGGTWHLHSYPGLACDVWAHSYTFSYAPNPSWSANFVNQPEIEAYLQRCAQDFGLEPYFRFNTRITAAHYQPPGEWLLSSEDGTEEAFDVVINAMGIQHTPTYPDLAGMDSFQGESWHSTHWNHDVDLRGKRVAVVGSAAAAVQIVPEIAKQVAQLYVLQRTPNWILPRHKKNYSAFMRAMLQGIPKLRAVFRSVQAKLMSMMHEGSLLGHKRMEYFENSGRKFIRDSVDDPALHDVLTPNSRFGCKRPLVSDDFFTSLNRDNVRLIASGAKAVHRQAIETDDGQQLDVDVIIYCTGYKVLDYDRITVVGEDGRTLADAMAAAPEAYKSIATPGFPNYFFGTGPNGTVQSVSYFATAETNVAAIVRVIAGMQEQNIKAVKVKPSLHKQYNDWLKSQFSGFSWGHSSCESYYVTANGASPFLFPGKFAAYKKQQMALSVADFETN